jgi:hypothetical protein
LNTRKNQKGASFNSPLSLLRCLRYRVIFQPLKNNPARDQDAAPIRVRCVPFPDDVRTVFLCVHQFADDCVIADPQQSAFIFALPAQFFYTVEPVTIDQTVPLRSHFLYPTVLNFRRLSSLKSQPGWPTLTSSKNSREFGPLTTRPVQHRVPILIPSVVRIKLILSQITFARVAKRLLKLYLLVNAESSI